jgi:hypothetical protein
MSDAMIDIHKHVFCLRRQSRKTRCFLLSMPPSLTRR